MFRKTRLLSSLTPQRSRTRFAVRCHRTALDRFPKRCHSEMTFNRFPRTYRKKRGRVARSAKSTSSSWSPIQQKKIGVAVGSTKKTGHRCRSLGGLMNARKRIRGEGGKPGKIRHRRPLSTIPSQGRCPRGIDPRESRNVPSPAWTGRAPSFLEVAQLGTTISPVWGRGVSPFFF